jgi:hypothetical protein
MKFTNLDEALRHQPPSAVTSLILSDQHLTELPAAIGTLTNLQVLALENNGLIQLPSEIGKLKNLGKLLLATNKLTTLPPEIGNLTKLTYLDVSQNAFTQLPDLFEKLENLKYFYAAYNQIEVLPDSMRHLKNLTLLYMRGNGIRQYPKVLAYMTKLKEMTGITGAAKTQPRQLYANFLRECKRSSLLPPLLQSFEKIYKADDVAVAQMPVSTLVAALTINSVVLKTYAWHYLFDRSGVTLSENPLKAGSGLVILGNTQLAKKEVKEKLQKHKIQYQSTIGPTTTHILIGSQPKAYEGIDDRSFTFLSEQELNEFLNQVETPFLLEPSDSYQQDTVNLSALLLSSDSNNVAVALQMLKVGGVPKELLTELFIVYKTTDEKKNQELSKSLLELNASPALKASLKQRVELVTVGHWEAQKKTYRAIEKYVNGTELDGIQLALLLHQKYGAGLRYVLDHAAPFSELKLSLLKSFIEGDSLDFSKHYTCSGFDANNPYSRKRILDFPKEIFEFTHLKHLNFTDCFLDEVPEGISRLTGLETLDLSQNFLTKLPADITGLKKLRKLNLNYNLFSQFPLELSQLPALTKLSITGNPPTYGVPKLQVSDQIQAMFPHCEIVINNK